jgi:hypothetical protein
MTNNKLISGRLLLLLTMAFGRWISRTTKIDKKILVTSLFSFHSNRFIRLGSVDLLALPSRNRNHPGQYGHGGAILTKFEKNATNQQCTRKKLYGLVPIIVLLRLAPRDCWSVVVLGQDGGCHGQLSKCSSH